jgi:MSHA biogenesis protein MshN
MLGMTKPVATLAPVAAPPQNVAQIATAPVAAAAVLPAEHLPPDRPLTLRFPGMDTELRSLPQADNSPAAPIKKAAMVAPALIVEAPNTTAEERPRDRRVKLTTEAAIKTVTPQQKSENHYKQALSLLQQGRVSEARDALAQSLEEDPFNHNARQTLVGLLVDSRHAADAIAVLQEGVRIAPEQSGFAMALARLQVEAGDRAAGLQTLERDVKYAGDDAEYHAFYAALLQRENRHDEAVSHYLIALRGDPANTSWLVGVGISLQEQGKFSDAREAYERARMIGDLTPELSAFVDQRLRQIKGK